MNALSITLPFPEAARWYSAAAFWQTLRRAASSSGRTALASALTLFLCWKDEATPKWAKGVIAGALGYLILPADMIPDVLPAIGWSDDWATLAAALATVATHVTREHRQRAAELVDRVFRPQDSTAHSPTD